MARPELTHCPHCKKALWDDRLDEKGYPLLDTVWELPKDNTGPGTRLIVKEVEPANRYGREIRGHVDYKTKRGGEEYDFANGKLYAADLQTFHKIWVRDPNAPVDRSLFVANN